MSPGRGRPDARLQPAATAGIHGGCLRLAAPKDAQIAEVADLRGKVVGVGDVTGPAKNFFSVVLKQHGIGPLHDVEEALILADRIVVMSPRPARIISLENNVPPAERHRSNPGVVALRRQILRQLGIDDSQQ